MFGEEVQEMLTCDRDVSKKNVLLKNWVTPTGPLMGRTENKNLTKYT